MPVDTKLFNKSATRGDVAGVAINLSVALAATAEALKKIAAKSRVDIDDDVKEITAIADGLQNRFDELTGYVD